MRACDGLDDGQAEAETVAPPDTFGAQPAERPEEAGDPPGLTSGIETA